MYYPALRPRRAGKEQLKQLGFKTECQKGDDITMLNITTSGYMIIRFVKLFSQTRYFMQRTRKIE